MAAREDATSARWSLLATAVCLAGVAAWTLLLVLIPSVRFSFLLPRFRVAIEAAGAVIALLAAALAYLRYSLGGPRLWMFIGVGFAMIALNQITFGVILPLQLIGPRVAVYIWAAGRLVAGVLFLLGALGRQPPSGEARHPGQLLSLAMLAALGILAAADSTLWALRDQLPALTAGQALPPQQITGVSPGLTGAAITLGLVGTVVYLLAAVAFGQRMRHDPEVPAWLPAALILAAFSHVHYALLPTIFSAYISTGDLLRLAFSLVVLIGMVRDVKSTYVAEHDRSAQLEAAYADERQRVRQLEDADRARAHLFEVLTHELMHPVASIRGFIVTLTRLWDELDEGTRRDFMSRLDRETDRLRSLAESAATAAELERAAFSLNRRPERAADLARAAAESTQDLGGRLEVRVDLDETARVMADPARIQQVLRNLLSNVEKYAPGADPVELAVEPKGSDVMFSLVDRGPGIGTDQHSRIFQRFARVRPPGMNHVPGSGLGLYISREIVKAHGGSIWVESQPGAGAAFRFTLPRTDAR